jgi:hypothetical protein
MRAPSDGRLGIHPEPYWWATLIPLLPTLIISAKIQSTCGSDGKIFIWDLSEQDGKEEKVIEDIIPAVQEE